MIKTNVKIKKEKLEQMSWEELQELAIERNKQKLRERGVIDEE